MSIYDEFAKSQPVTLLQHTLSRMFGCQDFAIMSQSVPSGDPNAPKSKIIAVLMIHDQIAAWKLGDSGTYGKIRVSIAGNNLMEGLTPTTYRAKFGCTCPAVLEGSED